MEQYERNLPQNNMEAILVDVAVKEQKITQSGNARPAATSVWQSPSDYAPTNLEYHCDAKLGTPKPVDCLNQNSRLQARANILKSGPSTLFSSSDMSVCFPILIQPLTLKKHKSFEKTNPL